MSAHRQKRQHRKQEGGPKAQMEAGSLVGVQVLRPEEEGISSACISSSSLPLIPATQREVSAPGPLVFPQVPWRSSSLSVTMDPTSLIQSNEISSSQKGEEGPFLCQDQEHHESFLGDPLDEKMSDLVQFLLLKYQMKELTTKAEMLRSIIKNYQSHFPVIFSVASEYMHLVFGIDVKEVDPSGHSYAIVNALGLTYEGVLGDDQSMPKTGLLIMVLCIIFMEGDHATEEVVWNALSVMGVYAGREHFIYGEPRKFITEDLVQEQYLEYRQVPGSDPACYEFLWGPRAHAETSKMKVLQYWARVHGSDPRSYPSLYEKAMREEEEGAQVPKDLQRDETECPKKCGLEVPVLQPGLLLSSVQKYPGFPHSSSWNLSDCNSNFN
ncbi:melanoma-associated antigen 8-like [Sciurus carolinensis]|uniref:melanoma-associated antigen 8-like n=1 Tax=Sciurus carolinensis TaxID=30640 RepID=UPI001FB341F5|nr:melanoma-associated antigen 8-like [Sciurus carolinensis]